MFKLSIFFTVFLLKINNFSPFASISNSIRFVLYVDHRDSKWRQQHFQLLLNSLSLTVSKSSLSLDICVSRVEDISYIPDFQKRFSQFSSHNVIFLESAYSGDDRLILRRLHCLSKSASKAYHSGQQHLHVFLSCGILILPDFDVDSVMHNSEERGQERIFNFNSSLSCFANDANKDALFRIDDARYCSSDIFAISTSLGTVLDNSLQNMIIFNLQHTPIDDFMHSFRLAYISAVKNILPYHIPGGNVAASISRNEESRITKG